MNIKITHTWLLEYLETNATPHEIQKYLSLSGPSIERIEKLDDEFIYDIEVISNRIDYASVFGIAQEAVAVLPIYGKKARLLRDPIKTYRFENLNMRGESDHLLTIVIRDNKLCSRFSAIVLDSVAIGPSPEIISKRLIAAGIKSINNVVDISNYLMLSFGQPVHIFDYDRIGKHTMIVRESRRGEKITTLDGKEVMLPGGDIVIEDGKGELIDLCGIMGGLNSSITDNTKRIVLFVQTYPKEKIRRTTMTIGVRTVAATYFEKGLDEERVEPTASYGVELLQKHAGAHMASKVYDVYPNQKQTNNITFDYELFDRLIGVRIERDTIRNIFSRLGFLVAGNKVTVPSYRRHDVSLPEDLVEEVARIYGYHNIPNSLPPPAHVLQPEGLEKFFSTVSKIKYFLKHLGLDEVINYSMISKQMTVDFGLKTSDHMRLSNSISQEIEYLRVSLLPSLAKNIEENTGKRDLLRFFEVGKVYQKEEAYRLGIAVNTDPFDLKGIVQSLLTELNIEEEYKMRILSKESAHYVELDLDWIVEKSKLMARYAKVNPYAVIKLDRTFDMDPLTYAGIVKQAKKSAFFQKVEVVSLYHNKLTLRFFYSSSKRNITEEEAKKELAKIKG